MQKYEPLRCNEVHCKSARFKQDCLSQWDAVQSIRVEPNRAVVQKSACHWIEWTVEQSYAVQQVCRPDSLSPSEKTAGISGSGLDTFTTTANTNPHHQFHQYFHLHHFDSWHHWCGISQWRLGNWEECGCIVVGMLWQFPSDTQPPSSSLRCMCLPWM